MLRRADALPPIEEVAAVTQRLAVLLTAGVSPVSAWGYLIPPRSALIGAGAVAGAVAVEGDRIAVPEQPDSATTAVLRAAARAASQGDSVSDAIAGRAHGMAENRPKARVLRGRQPMRDSPPSVASPPDQTEQAWLGLAAAWQVATQAGTPLSGCLRDLAASLRDLAQVQRDCEVALAAPRATARLVMVLPVIGLLFGSVMGFDTLHTLFATLPGLVCLVAGGLLMLAAASWNRALVRRAAPTELTPGLRLELMAIAMGGGGSMERARMIVQAAIERYRIGAEAGVGSGIDPIDGVLELSRRAGVPAVELLRSEAEQRRRDARSVAQGRAAALSVTLMLPLGVCVLPAFMLVGVVPLLISVLSSTLATF